MSKNEPKKILIIEDDSYVHELLSFLLTQNNNYIVTVASDGRQGLELLEEEKPDLIFLDYMLPKMDGIEVCRKIKAGDKTKDIPIVMMSASTRLQEQAKTPPCADHYILKPFNLNEVMELVQKIFKEGKK